MEENNVEDEILYEDLVEEIEKNITPEILKLFRMRDPQATKNTIIDQMDPIITGVALVQDKTLSLKETAQRYLAIAVTEEQGRAFAVNLLEETPSRPGFKDISESQAEDYLDLVARCDIAGIIKYNAEKCKVYAFPQVEDGNFQTFPLTHIEANDYTKIMETEKDLINGLLSQEVTKNEVEEERDEGRELDSEGARESNVTPEPKEGLTNKEANDTKPGKSKVSDILEVNKEATEEWNKNNSGTRHVVVFPKSGVDVMTYLATAKRLADAKKTDMVVVVDGVELKVKEFNSVDEMLKTAERIKFEKDSKAVVDGAARLGKDEVIKQESILGDENRIENAAPKTNSQQDLLQQLLKQQGSKNEATQEDVVKMQESDLVGNGVAQDYTPNEIENEIEDVAQEIDDSKINQGISTIASNALADPKFGRKVEDMKRDIVESARHHNIELNKSETERTNEEDRTLGPDNSHENGREM